MKATTKGFMVLLSLAVFAGNSFAAHRITTWPDNRKGAVSLGFDDGCPSHLSVAVPALNARGFKGTFFLITGDGPTRTIRIGTPGGSSLPRATRSPATR